MEATSFVAEMLANAVAWASSIPQQRVATAEAAAVAHALVSSGEARSGESYSSALQFSPTVGAPRRAYRGAR